MALAERVNGARKAVDAAAWKLCKSVRFPAIRCRRRSYPRNMQGVAEHSFRLRELETVRTSAFLDAARCDDPNAMRTQLVQMVDAHGVGACVDGVLFPAMRQIGRWRELDHCSISTERLAMETARAWIEGLSATAPRPTRAAPVLLACGPGDLHTLGVESLAMLLRFRLQRCRLLGARTSARALSTAVRANRPAGVVVVSQLRSGVLSATQALQALDGSGAHLFYAGAAFGVAAERRDLPGVYLGTSVEEATMTILETIGAHGQQPVG
jgi:MerR family transcriptional regulator, light-induced transcriptional regulator